MKSILIFLISILIASCSSLNKQQNQRNKMKLGYTILYVPNVTEAIAFYEKAFGLKRKFIHEGGDYGELDTGSTTLSFAGYDLVKMNEVSFKKLSKNDDPPAIEIALVTENVEEAFATAIAAGATLLKKPTQKPWGQIVGYVRDNNGFLVEICSPVK